MNPLTERFFRYLSIDTQSDPQSNSTPSTQKQFNLANLLEEELKAMELQDVEVTDNGYLYATLPSNTSKKAPIVGFVAHMDTSPDYKGEGVNPQIHENYKGEIIKLNEETILSPDEFPELLKYLGNTLITTDGTTLLGADDKAGITEIMEALRFLKQNSDIEHGEIRVGFTPDEEIGKGADHFDVQRFGADFAYTIDGSEIGELEFENFNAAQASVVFRGQNVHPGYAKDKMINSIHLAKEFDQMLPAVSRPEHTAHYEGFYHLISFKGEVEKTEVEYIVRDHDRQKFEEKKNLLGEISELLQKKYPKARIDLSIKDQYYNMREKVEPVYQIVELAEKAYREAGVTPHIKPIRGGTDGARLSYMGLPTPNIFTGGHNFHGRFEFIPLESMEKVVEIIVNICKLNVND
jgi:tripeptide aminopeptidase